VSGDPTRLQQVIWNLLSNAVKFTPKGGRVHVILERVNSHVEIRVIDSGDGISREFLPQVFDRFRQAESATTRTHGGLGIGLAIVKHLVELHGGTVTAQSDGPGTGSTFTVSLPIALTHADSEEMAEAGADSVGRVDLTGVRILVVDDDADALALTERVFQGSGAVVMGARSVSEAMPILNTQGVDIVLSDIGMPGEDGFTLMHRIRAMPEGRGMRLPVIALTAFARPEDRRRVLLAGFHLHLPKPVETVELRAAVATLVGRRPSPQGETVS
jgi:CheY-like chemotaxis protein/anti-sigma regulatory factor (Ser/Thr protein kinase)